MGGGMQEGRGELAGLHQADGLRGERGKRRQRAKEPGDAGEAPLRRERGIRGEVGDAQPDEERAYVQALVSAHTSYLALLGKVFAHPVVLQNAAGLDEDMLAARLAEVSTALTGVAGSELSVPQVACLRFTGSFLVLLMHRRHVNCRSCGRLAPVAAEVLM